MLSSPVYVREYSVHFVGLDLASEHGDAEAFDTLCADECAQQIVY